MSTVESRPGRRRAPRRRRVTGRPLAVAVPAAMVVTVAAVAGGVAVVGPSTIGAAFETTAAPAAPPAAASSAAAAALIPADQRKVALSRSFSRRVASDPTTREPRWTTATLNLWSGAGDSASQLGEVPDLTKVLATGRERNDRQEVVVDGTTGWVTAGHLSEEKPPPGISMAPCPDSSVERGLKASTVKVYRSVCHAFPEVREYGGFAARSEHNTGNALDVMVYGDRALGDRIAAWAQSHAAELDLYDVLWYQRIWTPVRAREGWRHLPDRGGATANHMDHVHIGTNP